MWFYNLIVRDLKLAFYSSTNFLFAASFLILILILLPFIIDPKVNKFIQIYTGFIWLSIALSILLTIDRVFESDYEDGNLDAIILTQKPLELIVCSKFISHWIANCIPIIVVIPISAILFGININEIINIILNVLAGSTGMVFIGSAVSSLTLGNKRSGIYKSIIVIPLYIPFIIFGANQESVLVLIGLSMFAFIFSLFTTTYSLRLYVE
jgi:heme exporter protein B